MKNTQSMWVLVMSGKRNRVGCILDVYDTKASKQRSFFVTQNEKKSNRVHMVTPKKVGGDTSSVSNTIMLGKHSVFDPHIPRFKAFERRVRSQQLNYSTRLHQLKKRVRLFEKQTLNLENKSKYQNSIVDYQKIKIVGRDVNEIFDIKEYDGDSLNQLRAILSKYVSGKDSQEIIRDMRDGYA